MMWLVAGVYCLILWIVFAKLRLLTFSLPIAIASGAVGPTVILTWLFCSQYFHPLTFQVQALEDVIPVIPQMSAPGRVTRIAVHPNVPVESGAILFEVDKVPYQNSVERLTASVEEANQSVKLAEAKIDLAKTSLKRANADMDFATSERDRTQRLLAQDATTAKAMEEATDTYERARAELRQTVTGQDQAKAELDLAKAKVDQARTELVGAKYDLEQSTVRAPGRGFVTNLQLRPGMLVGGPGAAAVMTFVEERSEEKTGVVVAMFGQKNYLLIRPDQYAEVVLDSYPGRVFTGRVLNTIDASGAGQLNASGALPDDLAAGPESKFAVRIRLDEAADLRLPGGMRGLAAVYTDHVQIAGIPVMFVVRAESWLNYLW